MKRSNILVSSLNNKKIRSLAAGIVGLWAFVLVFYLGYTNAAAVNNIMPERCVYRIFCYTVSMPALALLRIVPLDNLICHLLGKFVDMQAFWGRISLEAWLSVSIRAAISLLIYTAAFELLMEGAERFSNAYRQNKIIWTKRCTAIVCLAAVLFAILVGLLRKDAGNYRVCAYKLPLSGLPQSLEGLRLVFFADLHIGTYSREIYTSKAAEMIAELKPDILVGGGDYVFGSRERFHQAAAWMRRLKPQISFIGVIGNHDYWQGSAQIEKSCAQGGMHLLMNDRIFIDQKRQPTKHLPEEGICLAGISDLWSSEVDIDQALQEVSPDMPRILFSHNPDVAFDRYDGQERIDLIVSGHTHGGQVMLPWGTPLGVSTRYPEQLTAGWYSDERCRVYVNTGLGETVVPFRSGVKPEITLFVLTSGITGGIEELKQY
ncbi:MAG: metallophosphoesterase [Candidatus Bruticola sp.]